MAGQLNVGGNVIASHSGVEGAGEVTLQNVTLGDSAVPSHSMNFRNKIINGDMRIAQRGTSVFTAGNTYGLDRWKNWKSGSGSFTVEQSTDVPITEPFQYSLKSTVTTNSTPSGGNYYGVAQYIEGNNTHSLGFGTSAAKTITLSFWVKSSVTGTYSVAISNKDGATRTYAADYSISSANTWEKKSLTISGDVAGTWNKNNTTGLRVWFALGMGSTYSTTTSNSWESSPGIQSPSAIDWISNSGATFFITGVQLEEGTVPTPFEHRPYGIELSLCKRYFQEKILSSRTIGGSQSGFVRWLFDFENVMRIAPSMSINATYASTYAPNGNQLTVWGIGASSRHLPALNGISGDKQSFQLRLNVENSGTGNFYELGCNDGSTNSNPPSVLANAEL